MIIENLKISQLILDPANARKHSEKNLSAIKGSLAKFGQQKPIVVGKDNVVVAGNGTVEAAKSLGWAEVKVVKTNLIGPEAIAFAIADNRSGELAEWDNESLKELIKSLDDIEFDFDAIGFSHEEIDQFLLDGDAATWDGMPEFNQLDKLAEFQIIINFKSTEDIDKFSKLISQKLTNKTRSIWFPAIEIERYMDKRYGSKES